MKLNQSNNNNTNINNENDVTSTSLLSVFRKFITYKLILFSIIIFVSGLLIVFFSFEKAETSVGFYILREIGKAIFITGIITGAVKWYMTREYEKIEHLKDGFLRHELSSTLDDLQNKIMEQTRLIAASSASLDSLNSANVSRFFRSRNEASKDICDTLHSKKISKIKIIGISLNDFVRDEQKNLHSAWKTIENYILNKNNFQPNAVEKLSIKILLIDPLSQGAFLRSTAEQQQDAPARLKADVEASMTYFEYLKKSIQENNNSNIELEVKLYRTLPTLYLVWTPMTSYIQQYYLRPRHSADVNIPVLKFDKKMGSVDEGKSLHDELGFHFNWVWKHASIGLIEYKRFYSYGVDDGVRKAKIENVYYNQSVSRDRIRELIIRTKKKLLIKGITLKSFFENGDLFDAIADACTKENLEIKILLIDPESDQAKYRSFKEYLVSNSSANIEDFNDEKRKKQRLWKDITLSLDHIKDFLFEMKQKSVCHNFKTKIYDSASEAFLLITDEAALIEQYHYGVTKSDDPKKVKRKILGGNFPVIEYRKVGNQLYVPDNINDPYNILLDHFTYVFKHCSKDIAGDYSCENGA